MLSRAPTPGEVAEDVWFRRLSQGFAWLIIVLVFLIIVQIGWVAAPAMRDDGVSFLTGETWGDTGADGKVTFGILPEIWGTLYSSILGVGIGALFGIAVAIFLTQDFIPARWEAFIKSVIELLAAIPSVVYGLWGIFVLIPLIRPPCAWLHENLGWIGLFEHAPGQSRSAAGVSGAGDHGAADDQCDLPRFVGRGAGQAA